MRSVGIRELRERTSEIIRWVRDEGIEIQITHYGQPVARLVPVLPETEEGSSSTDNTSAGTSSEDLASVYTTLDRLAAEIGARWPDGISAVDAVAADRRDL
jgi:prevent-host-death family protein